MSIRRRSWLPIRRHSTTPFAALHRTIPELSSIPAHIDAPKPHTSSHHTHHIFRTTSAYVNASNPHISSHRIRTLRRTVPRGTVAKRRLATKRGLVANGIQFAKQGVQLRNGVQLQSRGKREDTLTMSCSTSVLASAVVRRPRQIVEILNYCLISLSFGNC